ncbi:hypothetical protein BTUL_0153g00060 [Botrytis tulipae]|uniref:Uncharacterized protein n=1 Tax=Botrytis tulipae TaxID=87230 RepID=A0A4Z1EE87_9HELO|nr:hypothetical protein BTUL_0153g00060 [Botrytis tulipae]
MTANKHVKHSTWHLSLLSSYFLVIVDPLDNILSDTARQRRTQGGSLVSARSGFRDLKNNVTINIIIANLVT